MLKDRGVRRTGKEGADIPALTQAPNLCGPDYHFMKAKFKLDAMNRRESNQSGPAAIPTNWEERSKLYGDICKIERRKLRGGGNFRPEDCC